MKTEDRNTFAKMMIALGEYYNREISDDLMDMYWNGMSHLDISVVREAMNRHMQNPDSGQFMPKVADVIRMTGGSTQDAALIAWSKVDRAIRVVGCYDSVVFDDALIHRVIQDMGGWIGFGNKTEEDWVFVGKEFENRYRGYASRSERPEYPPVLSGMAEAQNLQLGYKAAPPRLIGDPERAKSVYERGNANPLGITWLSDSSEQAIKKLVIPF
jgi:hypothetical protein